ncbi:glutamine-hydrolyzing carbamoyl-phosphate synthase small subunit [Candidatus Poribacteria bacterium]|nr:glutamine-hydrolyzing carbamoyl-phosphate synthase small subunit [Candidatus Poribacteria bacterium]MYG08687.1 glutamine-hydrolyzing carbamoyl-phosphate synthase small subunit [Candidatus Poribacteria bacterium]MYK20737.1 glutamine-hydrolyzing carbamoyl-phosphate synthase small subunit [Candidatus Poribacteria bacterium]
MKVILALADGTVFEGEQFGATGETVGEVVFNTSMTGYQEVLTDPSYNGQIVTMTYPLIGNYGCNEADVESIGPQVEGFVVREYSAYHSNWRSKWSLDTYLAEHNIIGIQGIDTRALTRRLRVHGVMNGCLSTEDLNPESLVAKAKAWRGLVGWDLVQRVTCPNPYAWQIGNQLPVTSNQKEFSLTDNGQRTTDSYKVVALDFGIKYNILRQLTEHGCEVQVVPAKTTAEEILAAEPDGVFLSNGPGDPMPVGYAIKTIQGLMGKKPLFGICLGHQLLGLALGGKTFKLKFGHRGANQPVKHFETDKVEITSQNHGFCVDIDSLPNSVDITHINLNDDTLEGIQHREYPVFSVQYHPEASPGPHDASYLFSRFTEMMKSYNTLRRK